jgi:hypothetical protein
MSTATSTQRRQPGTPAANQYGVSEVKYGTAAQVRFVTRLAAERDTAGLDVPADFSQVNKRHLSDWIELLLSRPERQGVTRTDGPSEKQVAFLKRLAGEKDWEDLASPSDASVIRHALNDATTAIGRREASSVIDWLMSLRRKPTTWSSSQAGPLEAGMYLLDGVVFKVQKAVHGSGNMYAKKLVQDGHGDAHFEYSPGTVRKLSAEHKMTLEQAKEYGALYGTCCVCGATLTNEVSIEAGIGPVCGKRF